LSNTFISLPRGVSLPIGCAPSAFSVVSAADVGPPDGSPVEYTCQPASILPVKITSTSVGDTFFCCTLKRTGVCAIVVRLNNANKAKRILDFIVVSLFKLLLFCSVFI
jgi:hypothetical protein